MAVVVVVDVSVVVAVVSVGVFPAVSPVPLPGQAYATPAPEIARTDVAARVASRAGRFIGGDLLSGNEGVLVARTSQDACRAAMFDVSANAPLIICTRPCI